MQKQIINYETAKEAKLYLTIQGTLNKVNSDFRMWPGSIDAKILKQNCPKCGSNLVCGYADMGTTEFVDTYHHICMAPDCDFIAKKDEFGLSMGERDNFGQSDCPFCRRNVQ
ncbi:hypothetical protein QUF75_13935 [Desulfococcaceae bacterium HSG7]|nr:hypothetical protein [Desulfococcaceae bacterium HSG7]